MTAYLDNNIFIYLENGLFSRTELVDKLGSNIDTFFYSPAHLQEAKEMTGQSQSELSQRLINRFKTISDTTKNNCLSEDLTTRTINSCIGVPSVVFETVSSNPLAQNAMKLFMNTISEEQKEQIRRQLNIDPARMNNYDPKQVIEQMNQRSEALGGHSFVGLIENAINLFPNGNNMGLSNRIGGFFELLDMVGYWKDKNNDKSNYARLWDSSHTYYSSYCDFFVSDDKRTRNKAKVVFEIFDIDTKIVSSQGNE